MKKFHERVLAHHASFLVSKTGGVLFWTSKIGLEAIKTVSRPFWAHRVWTRVPNTRHHARPTDTHLGIRQGCEVCHGLGPRFAGARNILSWWGVAAAWVLAFLAIYRLYLGTIR